MSFISRITEKKKMVITIYSIFILILITLCILCYNLYVKIDILTNPNYFPPEIETLFITEINVSEFEVLSTDHIENVIKDISEQKIDFINDSGRPFTDYESMPNSLKLLIDEFIDGFISRKDDKVTRQEIISDLTFKVTKQYVVFYLSYSSIGYSYTYYPDGVIRKGLRCGFTRKIKTINHFIDNDEIGAQKFYDSSSYQMLNDGELIIKNQTLAPDRKSYNDSYDDQISVEDYNLFRSDYLEGLVPNDFILTIKNIHKYLDKNTIKQ